MDNLKTKEGVMYFKLDNTLKHKLKIYCALHNTTISALLRELIKKTVKDMPKVTTAEGNYD